jgi:RimJ/RimL family protein N-acetyltransferase
MPELNSASVGALVREGHLVRLRRHVHVNKRAFQQWYADPDIVSLIRHDPRPMPPAQAARYFDSHIFPLSQRGFGYAIHEAGTDRLIGSATLVDVDRRLRGRHSVQFRVLIGEKDTWSQGYGKEATRLVLAEAFETHNLDEVRLKVFGHNPRAIKAYERVGFTIVNEYDESVKAAGRELRTIEMGLSRDLWRKLESVSDHPANRSEPTSARAGEPADG